MRSPRCPTPLTKREFGQFLAVAFALGYVPALAIGAGTAAVGLALSFLIAFSPALATLTSGAARRAARGSLRRPRGRWVLIGIAVGWGLHLTQVVVFAAAGLAQWDHVRFPLARDGSGLERADQIHSVLGDGRQPWALFVFNLLASWALPAFVDGLTWAIGEELGWRAVLQPELERRWGLVRGTVATGLIWAAWHLPVKFGADDTLPTVASTLLFFSANTIASAFAFGWLTRRAGSVWPASFAHAAHNATVGRSFLILPGAAWSTGAYHLVANLAFGGLFAYLSARQARGVAAAPAGAAEGYSSPAS
ncbi:MAG TPA: type II CAAX endopeptidase family protein [Polyangiaceae bacterium]|nr:type II CAAX endopeptidase family protein [Polyangiaceae bacterium]